MKVRTIFESRLDRLPDRMLFHVRGSGFLKHMVRNMVGPSSRSAGAIFRPARSTLSCAPTRRGKPDPLRPPEA